MHSSLPASPAGPPSHPRMAEAYVAGAGEGTPKRRGVPEHRRQSHPHGEEVESSRSSWHRGLMRPLRIAFRALAALVAVQLLAAASLPCPPHEDESGGPSRELLAGYAAGAPHATHGMGTGADHGTDASAPGAARSELRAPCPCPCSEAPAGGGLAAARLGPALLRAPLAPVLPAGAAALVADGARLPVSPHATPDPVPRRA